MPLDAIAAIAWRDLRIPDPPLPARDIELTPGAAKIAVGSQHLPGAGFTDGRRFDDAADLDAVRSAWYSRAGMATWVGAQQALATVPPETADGMALEILGYSDIHPGPDSLPPAVETIAVTDGIRTWWRCGPCWGVHYGPDGSLDRAGRDLSRLGRAIDEGGEPLVGPRIAITHRPGAAR